MNKMVKASVVGAAGVSLLMGGFGTYALWHDSAATGGSSVTSGVLDVNANTATWSDISATGPNAWTPGNPIVPGDKIKMTQTFDVKATGANMKGTVTFDPGAVDATAFGSNLTITPDATADSAFTSGRHQRLDVQRAAQRHQDRHRDRDLRLLVEHLAAAGPERHRHDRHLDLLGRPGPSLIERRPRRRSPGEG